MKLFVTGATGFIGSHFIKHALAEGHQVIGLRHCPDSRPRIRLNAQPAWLDKSVEDLSPTDFTSSDILVHLAAVGISPRPASWEACYRFNVLETLKLTQKAIGSGVSSVLAVGTSAEYGRAGVRFDHIPPGAPLEPIEPYAASKASSSIALCGLCVAEEFKLSYCRLFSVYGRGQFAGNFWPSLRTAAISGADFPMTEGNQVRDFIPVETVAKRLLAACTRTDVTAGKPAIENIGLGVPQTLRAFAEHWWRHWKAPGKLLIGAIPYRHDEIMRYVAQVGSAK